MTEPAKIDLTPHIKELSEALNGAVSEEKLRSELEKYVYTFKISIESSKSGILKKFNAPKPSTTFVSGGPVVKKIAELTGTETGVTVTAKILFVDKKMISVKGIEKQIISGIIGDDTGSVPFTIWSDSGNYNKGEVYDFKNAYVKMFREQPNINIGNSGSVVPNPTAVVDVPRVEAQQMNIGDITENTRNANVTGTLSGVDSRTIVVKGEEKVVFGGIIADSTGKIQFTAWKDFGLKDGMTIEVSNAYIRSWKSIPQLNIGDNSTVTETDIDLGEVVEGSTEKTVEQIVRGGGGLDISVTGTIVDLRAGSGLIKRCPQCNRSLFNDECGLHGHVDDPVMDLRLKTTVDDGTGAISVIINRADTEKITGITLEQAIEMAKEKGDMGVVANKITSVLLLKKITVTGNVMTDEYGPQMSSRFTTICKVDVIAEAEKLLEDVRDAI
ncbi:MAG: single-stranded DNA-binding protein [archaeon]|nr:single-stranded DNA-binding protein [archaeon]